MWFDVFINIRLAVVVGQLFAGLYFTLSVDLDRVFDNVGLAVRPTGVINVTSNVFSAASVHGPLRIDLKEILVCASVSFVVRYDLAGVFDHKLSFLYYLISKKTESSLGALNRNACWFLFSIHSGNA